MSYVACDQQTGQTSYYHVLADGPTGGREFREFFPLGQYVDEETGAVYLADEGVEPRWVGGCCYEVTLWFQHKKK